MKYILFSDIHCDSVACEQLVERSENVDFAIGAGDFALLRKGLQETIGMLAGIRIPTILVPGNHESHAELVEACEGIDNFHVLHGSEIELDGTLFCGIGGGYTGHSFRGVDRRLLGGICAATSIQSRPELHLRHALAAIRLSGYTVRWSACGQYGDTILCRKGATQFRRVRPHPRMCQSAG